MGSTLAFYNDMYGVMDKWEIWVLKLIMKEKKENEI